ncbi:MAG: shikimate dehydrogenase [Gemmatimonadota bacterium]|nr:shikimate dehydrogenase [Gemmatimonadota bacterium]
MDAPARLVLLGHPVAHSISPRFQNAALRAAGIPLTYELIDVPPDALDDTLMSLARERAAGNVTIPHKERLAERCARLMPLAQRVGAANVFWHEDGALVGDNSDVGGSEHVIRALLGDQLHEARVAVIGAGGGAAAVLCALERCGITDVRLYNRHMPRAEALSSRFPGSTRAIASLDDSLAYTTLVVNTTPLGLHHGDAMPVAIELLPRGCAVFDLAYAPGETAWVKEARNCGHRAADGEGMLVEQGAIAFERWFGFEPDRNVMWKAMA